MKKNKQYLVIGLGRFGSAVAMELARQGMQVLAVDARMERVEAHRSCLTDVVCADAMDHGVLTQIGADDFDVAIVTIGEDIKSSGVITMMLKEMGVKNVIVKAYDDFRAAQNQRGGGALRGNGQRHAGYEHLHRRRRCDAGGFPKPDLKIMQGGRNAAEQGLALSA